MGFGLHPLAKWDELPRRQRRHVACLQTNKGIQRGICRYASLTRRHRMSAYDTKRTCRRFVVSEDSLTRHRGAADMARQVIFVAARNPNTPGGGYDTYVRAHARAAVRAGFEPHIFCRGSPPGVQETDFGIVHQVALPSWRRFLQTRTKRLYYSQIASITHLLSSWTPRNSSTQSRALLVGNPDRTGSRHGCWAYVGVALQERLRQTDIKIVAIGSFYGSDAHHCDGKLSGLSDSHSLWQKIRVHAEQRWTRFAITPLERHAYSKARMIIVNYKCVEDQFINEFGTEVEVRRLPYASEAAFLCQPPEAAPAPIRALEPMEAPLIVSLSRHDPRKGVEILLRALGLLKQAGVRFRATSWGVESFCTRTVFSRKISTWTAQQF